MVKQFFKDTPNSVWFWNILTVLIFLLIWVVNKEIALGIYIIINFPTAFLLMTRLTDAKYDDKTPIIGYHFWVWLVLITWIFLILILVVGGLLCIGPVGDKKIKQFNNWLNKN